MSRKGLNIYKRKDGRWEARYIKSRTAQGKPLYGYLYASSYHEARNRLQDVIRLQGNAPNSKEMSKGSVFEFFSIEWLDTFSTSFKESTYIRYRTLIRCYLMPYFQTAKIESITKEHNEKHYSPQMLQMRGGYQNGNGHFHTIKRYDCLVGDQNDHQLNLRVTDRWYLDSLSTYHFTSKKW